eukprot:2362477-Rhodomonas_salina.1
MLMMRRLTGANKELRCCWLGRPHQDVIKVGTFAAALPPFPGPSGSTNSSVELLGLYPAMQSVVHASVCSSVAATFTQKACIHIPCQEHSSSSEFSHSLQEGTQNLKQCFLLPRPTALIL